MKGRCLNLAVGRLAKPRSREGSRYLNFTGGGAEGDGFGGLGWAVLGEVEFELSGGWQEELAQFVAL